MSPGNTALCPAHGAQSVGWCAGATATIRPLANRWQDALVRLAFTPHLQYQYASGKNTADIALALDAMEIMFDQRAETFCLGDQRFGLCLSVPQVA